MGGRFSGYDSLLNRTDRQFAHFEVSRIREIPKYKDFVVTHQGESVTKITIISPINLVGKVDGGFAAEYSPHYGVIVTTVKRTRIYTLSTQHYSSVMTYLNELVIEYRGLTEQTFIHLGNLEPNATPLKYTESIDTFYSSVRPFVAKLLVQELGELKIKKADSMMVVSLGCGQGDDLRECRELIGAAYPQSTFRGYDNSRELIQLAIEQSTHLDERNIRFFEEDCKVLNTFIPTEVRAKFNVGIAVGFLTQQVLTGTHEALPIYQRAYREFDVFINTGLTHPLITLDIATAIGWAPLLRNYKLGTTDFLQSHSVYILRKPTVCNILDRITNGLLDLSMSAVPLECMQILIRNHGGVLRTITKIDLSFAYFLPAEIELFLQLLDNLKNLKIIYHDPCDRWVHSMRGHSRVSSLEEKNIAKYKLIPMDLRKDRLEELPFYSRFITSVLQETMQACIFDKKFKYFSLTDLIAFSMVCKRYQSTAKKTVDEIKAVTYLRPV